ncbi:hypothetical protein LINPERPRIM_LOCUS16643 [Linum perenne]
MFFLSLAEHKFRLPPELLSLPLHESVKKVLDGVFVDKVISDLGLCVSIYDIKDISGGFIQAGDGASTYTVWMISQYEQFDLQYLSDFSMISLCQLINFLNHAIIFLIQTARKRTPFHIRDPNMIDNVKRISRNMNFRF